MGRGLFSALCRPAAPYGAVRHVHPVTGFVGVSAGGPTTPDSAVAHTHYIANTTGIEIPVGGSHLHALLTLTGPAMIPAGATLAPSQQAPGLLGQMTPMLTQLYASNPELLRGLANIFPGIQAASAAAGIPLAGGASAAAATEPVAALPAADPATFATVVPSAAADSPSAGATAGSGALPFAAPASPLLAALQPALLQAAAALPAAQAALVPAALLAAAQAAAAGVGSLAQPLVNPALLGGAEAALAATALPAPYAAAFPGVTAPFAAMAQSLLQPPQLAPFAALPEATAGFVASPTVALPDPEPVLAPSDPVVDAVAVVEEATPPVAVEVMRPVRRLQMPESLIRRGNSVLARDPGVVVSSGS